jgi:uncharacterized membrane-anchored protein
MGWARSLICAFQLGFLFAGGLAVAAEEDNPDAIMRSLHPQSGTVFVAKGVAQLDLGTTFRFLDAKDATTYLTKVLGNAPEAVEGIDGMIMPTAEGEQWFAVVQYAPDGHINDGDAATIDYDDLLKDMKEASAESAKELRAQGFRGAELLGWAQKPFYDSTAKKLYWAKALQFDGQPNQTLNYNVRILGRVGYINVDIVDRIDQLEKINAQMPAILSTVNFTKTNTYGDYVQGTDRLAAYGVAGLVAGGILAKAGLLKGLLVFLAASWKFIAVFVLGAVAAVRRFAGGLFRRKPKEEAGAAQ